MPIFNETSTIIKAVEYHLVSETETTVPHIDYFKLIWLEKLIDYLKRIFLLPPKFLGIGIKEKLSGTFIWHCLFSIFLLLGIYFFYKTGIGKIQAHGVNLLNIYMLVAATVPLFLVTFSLPSIYGHSGVSQKSVDFVVKHLQNRGFTSAKEIELLKKSVKVIEDRCRSRANVLKWLVGLLWACFVCMATRGFEHTITAIAEISTYVLTPVLLFLGAVISYIIVWGYDAALDKLFRTIEFGCNDFCYHIEDISSN